MAVDGQRACTRVGFYCRDIRTGGHQVFIGAVAEVKVDQLQQPGAKFRQGKRELCRGQLVGSCRGKSGG